jgi:UDP-N-acetyl-D-glucosamine dehydrogenase
LPTTGFDIDEVRVNRLNRGEGYISDLEPARIARAIQSGALVITADETKVQGCGAAFISVPTPLTAGVPDLRPVRAAAELLARSMARPALVLVESTNFPGSTEQVIGPIFDRIAGGTEGTDFYLAFTPERVNPGMRQDLTEPKIVGGVNDRSGQMAEEFLQLIFPEVLRVSSASCAEFSKLLENTYRLVNISLANQMAEAARACDVDIWEALEAAETKVYGFSRFDPGVGAGGHCIPIDPVYLLAKLREVGGVSTSLIEAAVAVNNAQPDVICTYIVEQLAAIGVEVADASILVFGLTYKPDIPDLRESAAIRVVDGLLLRGAYVDAIDPVVDPDDPRLGTLIARDRLDPALLLAKYDAAVVLTAHSSLDLEYFASMATIVVDVPNAAGRRSRGPSSTPPNA